MGETQKNKISKDTLIGEAMAVGSKTAAVIEEYFGGACLACGGRFFETIEMGLTAHGLENELETVVKKLQEAEIEDKKKSK